MTPTPTDTDREMVERLVPCPFCGGKAKHTAIRDGRQVFCGDCHASGPPAYHAPTNQPSALLRAITGWNERATTTPYDLARLAAGHGLETAKKGTIRFLIACIRGLEDATGESLESDDQAIVHQIGQDLPPPGA